MDQKVNEIDREVDDLTREFGRFLSKFDRLEKVIDELYREVGAKQGQEMSHQVDEIQQRLLILEDKINHIQRDAIATRKMTEYGDVRLKEIMKALSIIYRNTDELEGNLLEAENIQTS